MSQPEYIKHLLEVLSPLGAVNARAMFGGYGVYHDGLMFGLVANEVLYLKVDKQSKPTFEAEGLEPFMYEKNGKPMPMSYHQAPDEIYDDPEAAKHWAMLAYDAALRNKRHKK